ncbi:MULTISPECIES: hypothetical protein [unclassified Synechococcus]|uniref:hypothetical protein n=1 Tax=unclassified Synechococcus TaxID=2626047 RepID=UPI000AD20260|nr:MULTISPECIES: hypothetical protein [unclassified Synechococcus]
MAGVSFCPNLHKLLHHVLQRSMDGSMNEKENLVNQVFAKYRAYCREIGISPAEMMQQAYLNHLKSLTTEELKAKL